MLIKDKDITSYQLLLIKQDRVLVLASLTSFFDYTVVNMEFFFFLLFEKNGSVGRWETKYFNWDGLKGCYFKVRKLRSTLRTLLIFLGEKAPLYCYENLIT